MKFPIRNLCSSIAASHHQNFGVHLKRTHCSCRCFLCQSLLLSSFHFTSWRSKFTDHLWIFRHNFRFDSRENSMSLIQNECKQNMWPVPQSHLHVPCTSRRYFKTSRGIFLKENAKYKKKQFWINRSNIFVSESLFMAIDNVSGSTGCHWIASTDIMVAVCFYFSSISRPKIYVSSISCSVLVYYLRSKSKARIEMLKLLKQMLYIEAKDKAFLLANITRVTQNNGMLLCWFPFQFITNYPCSPFKNLEWLLDDCVKQPFLRPNRTIDRYADRPFASRKFSQPNFVGEQTSALYKNGKPKHLSSSDFITNGNAAAAAMEADRQSIS